MADKKRRHDFGITQRMNSCISVPQDEILEVCCIQNTYANNK